MKCNNILNLKAVCMFLIIFLFISACATQPEKKIIISEPVKKLEPVLSLEELDRKIAVLEEMLANNTVQEKDRVIAASLISDYHSIKALSQGDISENNLREIILTLFNNLSFFDEKYFSYQGQISGEIYAKAVNDLYLKKQSILKKYNSKDYKSVISECNELEKTFGKDSISLEIGILLAMSLAKEGRLSEAITLGDRIIGDIEGMPDLIQLRAGLIEWRINTGRKEMALNEYLKLIENMSERQSIFNKATSRVNSQNKKKAESDQALNKLLDKELNPDTESRISGILKELEKLKNHGDFTGARLLLLKWKMHADEPAEIAEIDKALASLDLSEKQYLEKLTANKKEGINAAIKLVEEEDYESAITMLDNLKTGSGSNPEIDKQKEIAVEKLINQERNRAAKIFLTAKKTTDTKKKRELLLSAQNILNGLIEKYHATESIERLKSNLNSVNEELNKIGK
jgi:hypothetical protein